MTITKAISTTFGLATAMLFLSTPSYAQDDDEGPITQGDDARYLTITNVSFTPGQRESAMEIITEHFVAAGQKAGTPAPIMAIHYQTGKWDATYVWEMAGGMADLDPYPAIPKAAQQDAIRINLGRHRGHSDGCRRTPGGAIHVV